MILVGPNIEDFHCLLVTSLRYATRNRPILLQIQPTPHFKTHKDIIQLINLVSQP